MKKKMFTFNTKTLVGTALGAALFTVLFMYVKIPTGIPETQLQTAYGIGGFFAALFGPLAGFLIAFIVLIKTNFLGGMVDLSVTQGLLIFVGCLPIAFVGFFSALYQARVAASAINMTGARPELSGRGVTMAVMVETYAVLALLSSFLMVFFVQI